MKRSFLVTISLILLMSLFPVGANAYNLSTGKWPNNDVDPLTWYTDTYVSLKTRNAATSAATAWNNAGLSSVSLSSSFVRKVDVTETNDETSAFDGWAILTPCGTCEYTNGSIVVNTAAHATYNDANALKSMVTHEFGHILGLAHNDNDICIMISSTWGTGSRYGDHNLTTPQSDDISGINAIY